MVVKKLVPLMRDTVSRFVARGTSEPDVSI
jgi:hypothetical protein